MNHLSRHLSPPNQGYCLSDLASSWMLSSLSRIATSLRQKLPLGFLFPFRRFGYFLSNFIFKFNFFYGMGFSSFLTSVPFPSVLGCDRLKTKTPSHGHHQKNLHALSISLIPGKLFFDPSNSLFIPAYMLPALLQIVLQGHN